MSKLFLLPFVTLILSVAICPLLCPHFWGKHFSKIIFGLSLFVILCYFFIFHDYITPVLAFVEYLDFILLIVALYIISGGIFIDVNIKTSPFVNVVFLFLGAVLANIIGTTGAAALLIRPFIKMNKSRIQVYHIVFFIFIVCNIGGCLSVIGDPPILIAFLKGMPFLWPLKYNFMPWLFTNICLLSMFFFLDYKNTKVEKDLVEKRFFIIVRGKRNLMWVVFTILSVFISPTIFTFLPVINFSGHQICFVRNIFLIFICFCAYKYADKEALIKNDYSWEPIWELIVLFFGIFITMSPALIILEDLVQHIDKSLISITSLYWFTAFFSSFLDNTPTLLNALAISMSLNGADISKTIDVYNFANGLYPNSTEFLKAICLTSVFFGGFTYIGNGPNFMIKSIAEKYNIKMPTFFGYIFKYSMVYLFPVLFFVWFLFCR